MLNLIKNLNNPLEDIKVDMGSDRPLYTYVQDAIQDIEIINILNLHRTKDENGNIDDSVAPFIHVGNWKWEPHPHTEEIQYRRRETGNKVLTKTIGNTRIGFLDFDIYAGARDKNDRLEEVLVHNKIYVPIEDDRGRYLLDNVLYQEYQLVDQLLYPKGKNCISLKSLLPIDIAYTEVSETSVDGYMISAKLGMVKIFTTMEPILSCFMHIPCVLSYLEVYPTLQFCDHMSDDVDWEYFQPIPSVDIYIKAFRKGLEEFSYVKSILVMSCHLIREYKPETIDEVKDPHWWTYQLSKHDTLLEHHGACHEMHVSRMLDTISAKVLCVPDIDKRVMTSLLKYALQSDFSSINVLSFENKRLRLNEVVSTIVTSNISDKLKRMFKCGKLMKTKDLIKNIKFQPDLILKNMYGLGTVHSCDFTNDMDYCQYLKFTRNGPNSLGRMDKHKVSRRHKLMHPSMIGQIDMLDYSKDVGQGGMISPYLEASTLFTSDINKYPNVKFELYQFNQKHFPNPALSFGAKNIVEYNQILDKLTMCAYIDLDWKLDKKKERFDKEKLDEN